MFEVEDLPWRKSSASNSGSCVEAAAAEGTVYVRDTKNREGGVLRFTEQEWRAFLVGVGAGEFELDVLSVPPSRVSADKR